MKRTNKLLSILLCCVMLLSLLTVSTQAAETYTKAGEIGAVTAECAPIAAPTLGGKVTNSFQVTVTSPTGKGVLNPTGDAVRWQRKSGDTWMDYTEEAFDEGTYRLRISLTSLESVGSYYALVSTTTLTVNDTLFTAGEAPSNSTYQIYGNASMSFYSQEYTVTKEAGTYLVTVTAGTNGRASADKVYGKTGEVVTLTAEPYSDYRLKEWRVVSGRVTVENDQFTIGSEDVEIKAIFESTNDNLGNITQVEVTKKEGVDYRPIMGRTAGRIDVTILSSTPDDDTLSVGGYGCGIWEVKQPDGRWASFSNAPFTYGTYRMRISLRNEVKAGKYHALTKDTVLLVDGEEWTVEADSLYTYYSVSDGYGMMSFVSEEMDVIPVANVSDSTLVGCYVKPVLGEFAVPLGDDFSFTVEPKDYYERTDSEALKVYVNDSLVTPDENGVYTIQNVTEDIEIYCDGSGFTGYSNLVISANGKTVTEKVYVGGTYTFKTLAEFGATVPENSTFTGWKIGGNTYQSGETYTVAGRTEIKVNAVFTGLHNITVENGKAYADEAHTIPISAAAEDQVIYIVADPAPEGKVFGYWTESEIASPGGGGWFGSYDAAETTYTVYYSDVVLAPVYETQIDNIVINGMTKPSAGVAIDNSDYSYKWGCSVPANSGYSLGICYWYDITDGEPEFAMSDGDVFQIGHTYRFKAKINLYGDTILAAKEDISVVLSGIDADSYTWTISEYSQLYENMVIYFEFTCQREKPDTTYARPAGDGTEGDPFRITNIGELYWFAAFVNGTASYPDDVTVERKEACAKLMNDITVNPDLLADDYTLNVSGEDTDLLAAWEPIAPANGYMGTFDGQGHTISGIYCAPQAAADYRYGGFFRSLFKGGTICNLTLADSYFCAPAKNSAYTGAFVGYIASSCTVENCHFDGTMTTAITADSSYEDKEIYQYVYIAGIAGDVTYGEIRDCTARGLISGYGSEMGGIAAYVSNSEVTGCVNEATVENSYSGDTGGIVGRMVYSGIIRDCRNKGKVICRSSAGIVSNVESKDGQVIRCWNEGKIDGSYGSGIVLALKGSVKNCYNTGLVDEAGIVGTAYSGSSVTYCHNVGEITGHLGEPICSISSGSNITIENCYYLADSETNSVDGTTYKTAAEFADGTVLALLNSGENAGNWKQDTKYPVLNGLYTLTVSGGTGSGTYGVGTEVAIAAEVPDGYVFAGWDGIDGLTGEDSVSTTILMPERDVTLTAKFESIRPTRPEGRGTVFQPFQISTAAELYWFAGFVNGTITADDISMSTNEVHAMLMNDITVNHNLLADDYTLNVSGEDTSLLAAWTPINPTNGFLYTGTFDGQGYSISGIYCAPEPDGQHYGFFNSLSANYAASGCIRDLTLKDSYFCAPARNYSYTGAFAGWLDSGSTVKNCHFDGTVTTAITADSANKEDYGDVRIAGIAGFVKGEVWGCTAKGLIYGYGKNVGGIAGSVLGKAIGCVNEATVESTKSSESYYYTGGIAGRLGDGIIQDCCNKGTVRAAKEPAGIVSYVEDAESSVIRCWNEGNIVGSDGAGIVVALMGGSVKNCYNVGSAADAGIVGTPYNGSSVTYCHNVGSITSGSDKSIIGDANYSFTVANCYYLADSEQDEIEGTTAMSAEQFSRQDLQMVTELLNSGENAGNWKQGDGYPVLIEFHTVTVSGGTGSGTYGVGTEVAISAEVPDGYVFAGWDGIDGLIVEAGQPARDTVATKFLMPKRDVTLTAKFVSTTPVRPAKGDGTSGNPFEITTLAELIWFQGYVNYEIEDPALYIVQPFKSCAKLMNDITVNHALLNDEGGTRGGAKLEWKPISKKYSYRGTFDGQGYSISGLYHDVGVNSTTVNMETCYLGLFGILGNGGVIRDLTVKDSYLGAPYDQFDACTGGIVASIDVGGTVENCHFNGIVTAPYEDNSTYVLGGIAAVNQGDIRNCTSMGLITGYFYYGGGIVGSMVQGTVTDCVNEATVENLVSGTGMDGEFSGGIVGTMAIGTIQECHNEGTIIGNNSGGIVGGAGWAYKEGAAILRCWNEGTVESGAGIAGTISGDNVTIRNCYNTGSVRYGIVNSYTGDGHSVNYCHNVGELTSGFDSGAPIISMFNGGTGVEVANCYYLADSELDEFDGTMAKTAAQFADGAVLALLNNGHWTQGEDDEYPVLGAIPGVTVSGQVKSYNPGNAATVQLKQGDTVKYTTTIAAVTGSGQVTQSFSFSEVAAGTYDLVVTKDGHLVYTVTGVVVESEDLDLTAHANAAISTITLLCGDLNGDGNINVTDLNTVWNAANYNKAASAADNALTDLNGDGNVNVSDLNILWNAANYNKNAGTHCTVACTVL